MSEELAKSPVPVGLAAGIAPESPNCVSGLVDDATEVNNPDCCATDATGDPTDSPALFKLELAVLPNKPPLDLPVTFEPNNPDCCCTGVDVNIGVGVPWPNNDVAIFPGLELVCGDVAVTDEAPNSPGVLLFSGVVELANNTELDFVVVGVPNNIVEVVGGNIFDLDGSDG